MLTFFVGLCIGVIAGLMIAVIVAMDEYMR
jgi:hypothetical protein